MTAVVHLGPVGLEPWACLCGRPIDTRPFRAQRPTPRRLRP